MMTIVLLEIEKHIRYTIFMEILAYVDLVMSDEISMCYCVWSFHLYRRYEFLPLIIMHTGSLFEPDHFLFTVLRKIWVSSQDDNTDWLLVWTVGLVKSWQMFSHMYCICQWNRRLLSKFYKSTINEHMLHTCILDLVSQAQT